ncbi:MAG: hypothetical protein RQ715_03135, partial [Methylococcales bacterium]|nr:hypothetical protein [Methylococcales bacterium]
MQSVALKLLLWVALASPTARAFDWSVTELHLQLGELEAPDFLGGQHAVTRVITLQHAHGWALGDNFLFLDYLDDGVDDGFNDHDWYGEWYGNLSLGKLFETPLGYGPVQDVGILLGVNAAADAKVLKLLPGLRLDWSLPGFAFLHTDLMATIDFSAGLRRGGAPQESNSFLFDINWQLPFTLVAQAFSLEGHIEYAGRRQNELGFQVNDWILAQPQLRWDMGRALLNEDDRLFMGVEYQFWW